LDSNAVLNSDLRTCGCKPGYKKEGVYCKGKEEGDGGRKRVEEREGVYCEGKQEGDRGGR
jgi:hypothetical protein